MHCVWCDALIHTHMSEHTFAVSQIQAATYTKWLRLCSAIYIELFWHIGVIIIKSFEDVEIKNVSPARECGVRFTCVRVVFAFFCTRAPHAFLYLSPAAALASVSFLDASTRTYIHTYTVFVELDYRLRFRVNYTFTVHALVSADFASRAVRTWLPHWGIKGDLKTRSSSNAR